MKKKNEKNTIHEYNIVFINQCELFDEFERSKIHINYNYLYLLGQNSSHTTLMYEKITAEGNVCFFVSVPDV